MRKDASQYAPVTIQNPFMAVIVQKKKMHTKLAQYLHASCLSPVKSTFEKAIKKKTLKRGQD